MGGNIGYQMFKTRSDSVPARRLPDASPHTSSMASAPEPLYELGAKPPNCPPLLITLDPPLVVKRKAIFSRQGASFLPRPPWEGYAPLLVILDPPLDVKDSLCCFSLSSTSATSPKLSSSSSSSSSRMRLASIKAWSRDFAMS